MNYIVDTNVVSELMRPQPSENVIDWFYDHEGQVWLTSITVKELYFGDRKSTRLNSSHI